MHALLVAGLGFGDEGKGTIVDSLVRETGAKWVVRYNGGAQAAHHVVTDDGRTHCFSQFGAGSLAGADTYLSRFMIVDPRAFLNEAEALRPLAGRQPTVVVDARALVATPFHRTVNQAQELTRGNARHGSCGRGMGEVTRWSLAEPDLALRVGDLYDPQAVREKIDAYRRVNMGGIHTAAPHNLTALQSDYDRFLREVDVYSPVLHRNPLDVDGAVVFEGAQGVLLDETYGFHPHTTWSNTTFDNALTLLAEAFPARGPESITKIGVTRAHHTRHGAGPFPSEISDGPIFAPGDHNIDNTWQGRLRQGPLDLVLLDYAIRVLEQRSTLDYLAVTWMDTVTREWRMVDDYLTNDTHPLWDDGWGMLSVASEPTLPEQETLGTFLRDVETCEILGSTVPDFIERLTELLHVMIGVQSHGPTASAKTYSHGMTQRLARMIPVAG